MIDVLQNSLCVVVRVLVALLVSMGVVQAGLTCEAPQQSYLRIAGDPALQATYAIRNTGTTPVTVRKITTNCSCTSAKADKETYAPGESGTVVVNYAYGVRVGPHVKNILIDTDDKSRLTLSISVVVQDPPLVAAPRFVWWKTGEPPAPKLIRFTNATGQAVRVIRVSSSDPRFAAALLASRVDGEWLVSITPVDTNAKGKATVTVESDFPKDMPRSYTIEVRVK